MRKAILLLRTSITILFVFFVMFACGREEKANAIIDIVKVKKGDIVNYIKATGRVESVKESIVRAEMNARIKKVFVKEGDIVKTGNLLISFDSDSVNLTELELNVKAKEAAYKQALINKEQAEREFNISKELYEIQAEALINLKIKEDNLRKSQNALLQAEEELKHAKNELETKFQKIRCISPQDGVVVLKEVKDGMSVAPGQPLATVADIKHLQISTDIDEVDAGRIRIGQEAVITSDAFAERQFKGHVRRIYPGATIKGERTVVEAIINLDETDTPLKIKNQVDIRIITDKKESALLLQLSAVSWENNNPYVWVKQNEMKKVFIKTGIADLNSIEILSGLKEGDEVVIKSQIKK